MHGARRARPAQVAALLAVLGLVGASAGAALAGAPSSTRGRHAGAQQLDTRTHQALLDVYVLDSRLHAARARLGTLRTAATRLRRQRRAIGQEIEGVRASLRVAQTELAVRLRAVYEQGTVDPVAVMLGSTSLRKAVARLDDLRRTADENRSLVTATRDARARLLRSRVRFATAARKLAASIVAARGAERRLESAVSSRLAYISSLRSKLRAAQVRSVVRTAHAVQAKSQRLQRAAPAPATPPPPSHGGRKLVVKATCYILPGRTATGMPVGHGVVAVDPSVIPLGTKLYIPGYGNGVAADVGGGIRGAIIDLWYATYAECAAWGMRTVTITIY